MPPRRLFHTSLSLRTFLRNSRSRSSLSDAFTRIIPRGPWLHLLRTTFSASPVPHPSLRYFLTRLCRRVCTASYLTMPPHNYRSRSSSSGAPSPMTLQTAKPRHRPIAILAAPHLHNPLTLLRFAVPAAPATPATVTRTLRLHTCHHSRHRVSRSMSVSAPHMLYLSGPGATSSVYIHLSHAPTATCQYHPSGNTSCALSYYLQEKCKYRPCGNPQSCWCRSSSRNWSRICTTSPGSSCGQIWAIQTQVKPDGLGHIGTADSDLMHHQYRLSVLQWNPTNTIAAACGRFHAVILQ